ncbi:MAG: hypothetical protein IJZ23_04725 [Roseburia sp.]|nr:hypothetical protein [Roseburia sp.]
MTSELLTAIIAAVTGAVSGGIVNLLLEIRRERRQDKKEKKKEQERNKKETYDKRPELEIVDYKNYTNRPGYGIKKQFDINIFLTKIENVSVEGDLVNIHYNKEFFDKHDWCCVIYTFKNVGKTDIRRINPICMYQKDTILCNVESAETIAECGVLNYSCYYDKKVRVGEEVTMKVCYHKDCIVTGNFSAIMDIGFEDNNGRYWLQPLFAPHDKIYDAYGVSYKEYRDNLRTDKAYECFMKPWLW